MPDEIGQSHRFLPGLFMSRTIKIAREMEPEGFPCDELPNVEIQVVTLRDFLYSAEFIQDIRLIYRSTDEAIDV